MRARGAVVCALLLFAAGKAAAVEGTRSPRSQGWVRWTDAHQALAARGLEPGASRIEALRARRPGNALAAEPGPGLAGAITWTEDGIPICNVVSLQAIPSAISDNSGGVIAAWIDFRSFTYDIYATRLDGGGNPVWAPGGVAMSTSNGTLFQPMVMPDGANGAFVIFGQFSGADFSDVFVQRVTSTGAIATGWPADGRSTVPGGSTGFGAVTTADGSLLMGWTDRVGQLRLVRLTGAGALAPGWNAAGLALGHEDNTGTISTAPDGAGGGYVCWAQSDSVMLTRVAAGGGVASGWTAAGKVVAFDTSYPTGLAVTLLTSGDVMLFWPDLRSFTDSDIYAMRFTPAGVEAGGWPASGTLVVSGPANDEEPLAIPDAAGGAVLVSSADVDSLIAQRVTGSGGLAAGWTGRGVTLGRHPPFSASGPIPDGSSGALVAWSAIKAADEDLYAQRVAAGGALAGGWPNDGQAFCQATGSQNGQVIVTDGGAGLIAVWDDNRNPSNPQVYAARVTSDGTVDALAALVSASAEPGLARLHWFSPDGAAFEAGLERAAGEGAYAEIARVRADGTGHVRYDDRDVVAGETYRYRLVVVENGATSHLGEVTLRVPSGLGLSLAGFVPNPVVGAPRLVYTLPTAERARIEVLDTAGRRVVEREVESTPGEHVVSFESARLGPGVYVLRLTQGSRSVTARAAIVR